MTPRDYKDDARRFLLIWNHIPPAVTPVISPDETFNAADLLPDVQTTYRYSGSLTPSPHGGEGVSWFIMADTIHMSPAQVYWFEHMIGENNRSTQPLSARPLLQDSTP